VPTFAEGNTDWQNGKITAVGIGVEPTNAISKAQGTAMARRAAIVDAYRNLAEYVEGVKIDSETTVENSMVLNDTIRTKVSALVKNARVISEKVNTDGSYIVTVEMPIYGSMSLASAVFDYKQNNPVVPFPNPSAQPPVPARQQPGQSVQQQPLYQGNAYTGLVIDCRGLGLEPVMSPVVYNDKNVAIYGHQNLDTKKIIAMGMASYENEIPVNGRAGTKPLIVKAVSLAGHSCNPVISEADANQILFENASSRFLDNTAVVFVR
jgi:hypothetical protein